MRILFLTENFPPETNAAASRVYERACYWAADGHDVTIITSAPNFPDGKLFAGYHNPWWAMERMSGIRVVRVKTFIAKNEGVARRTLDFVSFMVSAFGAGLFEKRPDVIAATSPQFFAAVGGWALAAARRIPFVFELGDLWPASIAAVGAMRNRPVLRALERLELFLYRRAASVVALSPAFRDDLIRRGIAHDKIAVVINGVDLARYGARPCDAALAAEWGLTGRCVIGYVGTHGMAHALGNVLDAAERLRGNDRVRFLLVGAGAERAQLVADAQARALTNVVFAPMQPKSRMPAVWSVCDVALVHLKNAPAFAEVIPSKIFEAMAMGLPLLVAAPAGIATRLVEDDGAGLIVPAEDPDALARAAETLADDAALRRRLAAASSAAAPKYSRARQADAMLAVLRAAADGDGAHAARYVTPAQASAETPHG